MADTDEASAQARAEVKRLQAETAKLELEVAAMKKPSATEQAGRLLGLATAFAGIVAVGIGACQFNATQRQELQKSYWEKQLSYYERGAELASEIATAPRLDQVDDQRREFFQMYWGKMSLLEHVEVERAMNAFRYEVEKWPRCPPGQKPKDIEHASFVLAHCFRKSLQQTWPGSNDGLADTVCPYSEMGPDAGELSCVAAEGGSPDPKGGG